MEVKDVFENLLYWPLYLVGRGITWGQFIFCVIAFRMQIV